MDYIEHCENTGAFRGPITETRGTSSGGKSSGGRGRPAGKEGGDNNSALGGARRPERWMANVINYIR